MCLSLALENFKNSKSSWNLRANDLLSPWMGYMCLSSTLDQILQGILI